VIENKSPEEEIVIASNGTKRILGQDAGSVVITDDFDVPLDPETMR